MRVDDLGKLFLRLMIGGLLLMHGIAKLRAGIPGGIDMIGSALVAKGLPDWIRFGVYLGEVVGPLLVILGFLTRLGALMIAVNMAMAIFLAHTGDVGKLNQGGGWAIELEVLFLLGGLAILCLGAGRVSLRRGVPKID